MYVVTGGVILKSREYLVYYKGKLYDYKDWMQLICGIIGIDCVDVIGNIEFADFQCNVPFKIIFDKDKLTLEKFSDIFGRQTDLISAVNNLYANDIIILPCVEDLMDYYFFNVDKYLTDDLLDNRWTKIQSKNQMHADLIALKEMYIPRLKRLDFFKRIFGINNKVGSVYGYNSFLFDYNGGYYFVNILCPEFAVLRKLRGTNLDAFVLDLRDINKVLFSENSIEFFEIGVRFDIREVEPYEDRYIEPCVVSC